MSDVPCNCDHYGGIHVKEPRCPKIPSVDDYALLQQRYEALRITLSCIERHLADVGTVNTEAEVGVLQLAQRCTQAEARVKWLEEGRKYVMPSRVTISAFNKWLAAEPKEQAR